MKQSGGRVDALGPTLSTPKGEQQAVGLFLLLLSTSKTVRIDPPDPIQNIQDGLKYFRQQLDAACGEVGKSHPPEGRGRI